MSDWRGADSDIYSEADYTFGMNYPVTYVRLLVRIMKLSPSEQNALLCGTSLTGDKLENLEQQVTQSELTKVIANLLRQIDLPNLGMYMGSRMPIAAHGPLGQLLSSSPDLSRAWDALSEYQLLRLPFVSVHCSIDKDLYIFELDQSENKGVVSEFVLDTLIVSIQRGIELILGKRLREAIVELKRSAPADISDIARYIPGEVRFSAESNRMLVPLPLMTRANPYSDPAIWQQTLKLCERLKSESKRRSEEALPFAEQIRQLIEQQTGKLWSLEEIAGYFHLSPRTVIRRLKAEDTKYQDILNTELEKKAKLYLSTPGHTVESVALSLGYQDTSAFRRAFKRWCGVSPSAWRQQQHKY